MFVGPSVCCYVLTPLVTDGRWTWLINIQSMSFSEAESLPVVSDFDLDNYLSFQVLG